MQVLKLLLSSGIIAGVCYIATVLGKCYVVKNSKELDSEKVKALAKMMSKDININIHS